MTQTVLSVPDISCDHCARAMTNALSPLEGIESVAIDVPTKRVTVEYDPAQIDVARMSAVLADEDYPVAEL